MNQFIGSLKDKALLMSFSSRFKIKGLNSEKPMTASATSKPLMSFTFNNIYKSSFNLRFKILDFKIYKTRYATHQTYMHY
jgi:hypothetical protein